MASKRNIFEDVTDANAAAAQVSSTTSAHNDQGWIILWLKLMFLMVALIIVVGGLTRLTDSGLSITEWAPISGVVPPLSAEAWQIEFEKYQKIPEFLIQNSSMTMSEFQYIYLWEWGHRLLARLLGFVWFVGLVVFAVRRSIPRGWTGRLVLLGVLGAVQGFVGWWMVSSGLSGRMVDVASYRLAIHLGLAFIILGLITWYVMSIGRGEKEMLQARRRREVGIGNWATVLACLIFVQMLIGALVAGLDAGRGYTDWPLMGGKFFPDGAFNAEPAWTNFFENVALTQFNHRILAYCTAIAVIFFWWLSRQSALNALRSWATTLAIFTALQVLVGIVTVLYAAPLNIAIVHQFGAIVLWVVALATVFNARYPRAQSLR